MALITETWRCMFLLPLQKEENVQVGFPPKALLCMLEKLLLHYVPFLLVCFDALGKICA